MSAYIRLPYFIFLFLLISVFFINYSNGIFTSSIRFQSYNISQAKAIINQTETYLYNINQSGYLFINPNLTQAYTYMNRSQEALNYSPNISVAYAKEAESSANVALGKIDLFREYALIIVAFSTLIIGLLLYILMFKRERVEVKHGR
ncbi:MAG: hypothetical protein ACP5M9_04300 [Candidatus Micrarchaeia archaeon]